MASVYLLSRGKPKLHMLVQCAWTTYFILTCQLSSMWYIALSVALIYVAAWATNNIHGILIARQCPAHYFSLFIICVDILMQLPNGVCPTEMSDNNYFSHTYIHVPVVLVLWHLLWYSRRHVHNDHHSAKHQLKYHPCQIQWQEHYGKNPVDRW